MADTPPSDPLYARCPNCLGGQTRTFYSVERIPVHSVLLMDTREEAVNYPRGDLRLAFCRQCGFIFNDLFEPAVHEYSPRYEETQHFSGRFRQFASELCRHLIDEYGIAGKTVIDIGCGKGEFLALLCELGENRGIGIDPSCIPERLPAEHAARVRLVREFYSERHAELAADLLCCRHTLEHIADVDEFLRIVRASVEGRPRTQVFFEVPDVQIVLDECRFWDVYYEHCSYFAACSLEALFRRHRFEILETRCDYDDQYLWLMARPIAGTSPASSAELNAERAVQELSSSVDHFQRESRRQIDQWRERIIRLSAEGKRPVVWGAGSKCVAFLTTLGVDREIAYAVDINPHKQGRYLPGTGHLVVGPEYLTGDPPGAVIVMNSIYCDEIARTLAELSISAELIPT